MKEYKGDVNSSKNQQIKDKFVEREIIMKADDIVAAIGWEDLSEHLRNSYEPKQHRGGECKNCGKHVKSIDTPSQLCEDCFLFREPFEYWFITNYLADKLSEQGEIIYDRFNQPIWGRCTTGQAISLDSVIDEVCLDMEILEGQKYEW